MDSDLSVLSKTFYKQMKAQRFHLLILILLVAFFVILLRFPLFEYPLALSSVFE